MGAERGNYRGVALLRFAVLGAGLAGILLAPPLGATPKIEHWQTANGARVLFVPAPQVPMVDVRVIFDAGSARDADRPGLAQLTSSLLAEGAGELDADAIAERFDDLGARLGAGAERDSAYVSLRSLSDDDKLDVALETMATVVSAPRFAAVDLERERGRTLVALRAERESPGAIAQKAFYRAVYGAHPYASPPQGNEESVAALRREDLVEFHRRYYVARNALVAIVGAVGRDRAAAIAERLTQGLPVGQAAAPLPPVPALEAPQVIRIDHPSQQTHLLIGQPGMSRSDPDYFALFVANQVLGGGGLVSRLSEEVRARRGLSYSVYSFFSPMLRAGPFQMGLQTRNDQAEQAREVLLETLRAYLRDGPSDEELDAVKRNLTGGFPLRIDSNGKIAGYLGVIGFYQLPLDYLDQFTGRIEALSREQVHRAMRERVDPQRLVTVIVGGAADAAR